MKSSIVRRGKTRNAMRFGGMASAGLDRGFVALGQRLIAFRVRAHPALGRRARERSADLGRRAEGEHAFGNLRLGRHQGTGGHHGAGADPRAVEHGRAVSDQTFLAERRRVDRAVVADRRAGADLGSPARRHVDDGAILHVGAAAHHDRVEVAPEDGVVPDGRALLDRHVADDDRGGRDERGRMHLRTLALEAEQWHGLDPRSILEIGSHLTRRRQEVGMPFPNIAAVATATPPHRFTQAQLLALAGYADEERRGFFRRSDIDGRHLWIDPAAFRPDESVDELNDRFRAGALHLGESAARGALARAGWDARDVDFIATTTCTGRLTPSLDAHLISRLGCRADIQRVHVGDTGCASALVALQQAANYLTAFPGRRALVNAVEICSAAYFLDDRLESAVAHAIFADGAGALALGGDHPRGPAIIGHRTLFSSEHLPAMGFEYPGGRPRVVLSKDVRRIGATMMGQMARALMETQGLKRDDVAHWVLHSAGRRVLDRARDLLELTDAQMAHPRAVLREHGNMSSATILFVLERLLRLEHPVPGDWGLMIGLGPGFAAEGALLRW